MRVQHRAEYGAPLCEGMPGQQGEKAAGRAFDAFGIVAVPELRGRQRGCGTGEAGWSMGQTRSQLRHRMQESPTQDAEALVIRR